MHLLHHNYPQWFAAHGVFQGLAITCHKHGANWSNTNELKADTGKRHSESAYVTMLIVTMEGCEGGKAPWTEGTGVFGQNVQAGWARMRRRSVGNVWDNSGWRAKEHQKALRTDAEIRTTNWPQDLRMWLPNRESGNGREVQRHDNSKKKWQKCDSWLIDD